MKLILDASALECLIGGDTEAELELRQSVAAQFAEKYLKALVNTDIVQQALSDAKDDIDQRIEAEIITIRNEWRGTSTRLKPEIIQLIRDNVTCEIKKSLEAQVESLVKDELKALRAQTLAEMQCWELQYNNAMTKLKALSQKLTAIVDAMEPDLQRELLLALAKR